MYDARFTCFYCIWYIATQHRVAFYNRLTPKCLYIQKKEEIFTDIKLFDFFLPFVWFWSSIFDFLWSVKRIKQYTLYFKFLNATQLLSILPLQTCAKRIIWKRKSIKIMLINNNIEWLKSNINLQTSTFQMLQTLGN